MPKFYRQSFAKNPKQVKFYWCLNIKIPKLLLLCFYSCLWFCPWGGLPEGDTPEGDPPQRRQPPGRRPPKKEAPPRRRPPKEGGTPQKETPQRRRHPPEGDPPKKEAPPTRSPQRRPPKKEPPPQGDPPPPWEADSGIRSMSGRYASYWNAFLLLCIIVQYSMWSLRSIQKTHHSGLDSIFLTRRFLKLHVHT